MTECVCTRAKTYKMVVYVCVGVVGGGGGK